MGDSGWDIGQLSQDVKAIRCWRSFHVILWESLGKLKLFLLLHRLLCGGLGWLYSRFRRACHHLVVLLYNTTDPNEFLPRVVY